MVDIGISNPGASTKALLKVAFSEWEFDIPLPMVAPGETTHRVAIPDIREAIPVRFRLYADDTLADEREITWKPGKHWHVYLVQVSHHDLGYTDLPSNILREYEGFFDDILRFCRETDDYPAYSKFHYTVEQAWSILHYLENRPPEVVEEMVRRIKEGRIEVNALFGNETSDLCGSEELIRLLYPAFRLRRKYGIPIRTAELNDVSGLSWGLCAAMAGAGVKYFAPGLPTYFTWAGIRVHNFFDEDAMFPGGAPDAFWWEAPDGQKVLFWHSGTGAGGDTDPLMPGLADRLAKVESQGYPYDALRYWIMGGRRDNAPPRVEFCDTVRAWNEEWAYPHLTIGTNTQFFEHLIRQVGPDLRAFRGELPNTDFTVGAHSTARETAVNRVTHDALLAAERFATIAAVVSDYAYPAEALREACDAMLLYDEHTWGAAHPMGPAQDANCAQKAELAYRAAALAQDVAMKSLYAIADRVAIDREGQHVIVFNSLPVARTDLVRAQLRFATPCSRPMTLLPRDDGREGSGVMVQRSVPGLRAAISLPDELADGKFDMVDVESGQAVPFQIVRLSGPQDAVPDAAHRWALGHVSTGHLYSIEFLAEDVPALGCRTYRIAPQEEKPEFPSGIQVGDATLENKFYKVSLDAATGAIKSIFDKELGRELVDANAPHMLNQVVVRSVQTHDEYKAEAVTIRERCSGPISASLVVTGSVHGIPQFTQEVVLYGDVKRIDLATRLLKDSTPLLEVYIAFPFDFAEPRFRHEGALSVIEPLRDQLPGSNTDYYGIQHWANVSDGKCGVTWSSLDAAVAEFGGLWPGYVSQAHHGVTTPGFGHEFLKPGELKKGYIYSYVMNNNFRTNFQPVQVGEVLFRYSMTSGKGDWMDARARDFGWSASLPLVPVYVTGPSDGPIPAAHSFCRVDAPNIVLLALKQAEDGDGLILRLWETEGKSTEATVHLPFIEVAEAWETNLVEENQSSLPSNGSSLAVPVKASGITTARVRPA